MKDYKLFQSEFKKWQQKFGLMGYKVYFKHEPIEGCHADITGTIGEFVATARLNSKRTKEEKLERSVVEIAKHEAIHLLLRKLEDLGKSRYLNSDEINEAIEELTYKLERLID